MYRAAAPTYHRCPLCRGGYRRTHLRSHLEQIHPEAVQALRALRQRVTQPPSLWSRFVAWIRSLVHRRGG